MPAEAATPVTPMPNLEWQPSDAVITKAMRRDADKRRRSLVAFEAARRFPTLHHWWSVGDDWKWGVILRVLSWFIPVAPPVPFAVRAAQIAEANKTAAEGRAISRGRRVAARPPEDPVAMRARLLAQFEGRKEQSNG